MPNPTTHRWRPRRPLDHDPAVLRRRRVELGLSQAKAAKAAGISPGTLSELEGGTRNPSPETLKRIADALDCATTDLMPQLPAAV